MMRRYIFLVVLVWCCAFSVAQKPRKFDPKRFEIEMRQFITTEAGLTPKEAAAFFPLFDEMQQKQRVLFDKMQRYRFVDTKDERASLEAIKGMDDTDIAMKKLQKEYHLKFCKVLPPGKVLAVIKADEKFHRDAFKRMMRHGEKNRR